MYTSITKHFKMQEVKLVDFRTKCERGKFFFKFFRKRLTDLREQTYYGCLGGRGS